ncbi:carbohydrate sulfotransferase 5-like [Penaeus japonicus]|uniref:carbohydrate sulfotransferase 5-like n=1 Tax=Penaeus japonicus TaxID=27405 RepID=UPI001C7148FF|nr:carbohydrate sulfotransferase 5-like [Penaeus japonicus]
MMILRRKHMIEMALLALLVPCGLLYGIKLFAFPPSGKYQVSDTRSIDESRGKNNISLDLRGETNPSSGIFGLFSRSADEESTGAPTKGLKILLLSSVGRSGSSLLGELLAQMPNTLYFFEPLMYFQKRTAQGVQPTTSISILRNIYSCKWTAKDRPWGSYNAQRQLARQNGHLPVCSYGSGENILHCLKNTCLMNTNIVIKVIRMRVKWLDTLLSDGESGIKVIHLVRDPRGSFLSLKKQVMAQRNPEEWCPAILQDVKLLNFTKSRFPDSFTSVKYEDFCRDPEGVATNLWKFISGNSQASLPRPWQDYLKVHTDPAHSKPKNKFGTLRNTHRQVQAWRRDISEGLLRKVENACGEVIHVLGHRRFYDLRDVRNLSIPLVC